FVCVYFLPLCDPEGLPYLSLNSLNLFEPSFFLFALLPRLQPYLFHLFEKFGPGDEELEYFLAPFPEVNQQGIDRKTRSAGEPLLETEEAGIDRMLLVDESRI